MTAASAAYLNNPVELTGKKLALFTSSSPGALGVDDAVFHHHRERGHTWTLALASHHAVPWQHLRTLPRWPNRARRWALASSLSPTTSSFPQVSNPHIPAAAAGSITLQGSRRGSIWSCSPC